MTYYVSSQTSGAACYATASPIVVGNVCALPVTRVSFEATKNEHAVILRWSTTSEVNSSRFAIERSADAKVWKNIGEVKAGENTRSLTNYDFADKTPLSEPNYYRLKMIDFATATPGRDHGDGSFAYSRIVNVTFETNLLVSVYPNPAASVIRIKLDGISNLGDIRDVKIYNLSGKTVYTSSTVANGEINVNQVPAGAYILAVTRENGSVQHAEVIITK